MHNLITRNMRPSNTVFTMVCLFTLLVLVGDCSALGTRILINLLSYHNPLGTTWSGEPCGLAEAAFDPATEGQCDHRFQLCFGLYDSNSSSQCVDSGTIPNSNTLKFDTFVGKLFNPLMFHVDVWPGRGNLTVTVLDTSGSQAPLLVDRFAPALAVAAAQGQADAAWTEVIVNGLRPSFAAGGGGQTLLHLQYTVYCDEHYHGPDCRTYCKDTNDNSGHYTCDAQKGERICLPGWFGARCTEFEQTNCWPGACQSGACIDYGSSHVCHCEEGFAGERCEMNINECESNPCVHGSCIDGPSSWTCRCLSDLYTGLHCELLVCTAADAAQKACRNGAKCTYTDTTRTSTVCECPTGFAGKDCSTVDSCADINCGRGECKEGTCDCEVGFLGSRCDLDLCDLIPCVHGVCEAGMCRCDLGWEGRTCERSTAADCGSLCQNGATCINGLRTFMCSCQPGYTGQFCEETISTIPPTLIPTVSVSSPVTQSILDSPSSGGSADASNATPTWLVAILTVIAVILAGLFVVVLIWFLKYRRRRKKPSGGAHFNNPVYGPEQVTIETQPPPYEDDPYSELPDPRKRATLPSNTSPLYDNGRCSPDPMYDNSKNLKRVQEVKGESPGVSNPTYSDEDLIGAVGGREEPVYDNKLLKAKTRGTFYSGKYENVYDNEPITKKSDTAGKKGVKEVANVYENGSVNNNAKIVYDNKVSVKKSNIEANNSERKTENVYDNGPTTTKPKKRNVISATCENGYDNDSAAGILPGGGVSEVENVHKKATTVKKSVGEFKNIDRTDKNSDGGAKKETQTMVRRLSELYEKSNDSNILQKRDSVGTKKLGVNTGRRPLEKEEIYDNHRTDKNVEQKEDISVSYDNTMKYSNAVDKSHDDKDDLDDWVILEGDEDQPKGEGFDEAPPLPKKVSVRGGKTRNLTDDMEQRSADDQPPPLPQKQLSVMRSTSVDNVTKDTHL